MMVLVSNLDDEIEKKSLSRHNNAGANLDFLGPSYMFNIDKKSLFISKYSFK